MTEVLFILTTIFVAYVAYALVSEQKAAAKTQAPIAQPEKKVVAEEQAKPKAVATKAKTAPAKAAAPKAAVAPKPVATKAAAPKVVAAKKAATAVTAQAAGLKDPKTGEVAKTYSNYRFTKRWIKDALVAEGLLDKVYATNELDTATEAKIKSAIAQLESMPKYQA
jgi:outer membrane biosynthesis protein TonB